MHRALWGWGGAVSGCEWTSQWTGAMTQGKENKGNSGGNVEQGVD